MSEKKKLLVQLDPDPQPSLFDRIVAFDAGADEVLSHGSVRAEQVRALVHGCIFTRGPKDLAKTAIFIGGSEVAAGEALLAEAKKHLLPEYGLSVSLLLDANGANTTAAAAVRILARHLALKGASVGVLGAGAVGARIALMLASAGATVQLVDVQASQAESVRQRVRERLPTAALHTATELDGTATAGMRGLIAAGPAGKEVLAETAWANAADLAVVLDLNAVPPAGLAGVDPNDNAEPRHGKLAYGALAVGGLKMKVHKAAVSCLFHRNDVVFDAETILPLAMALP